MNNEEKEEFKIDLIQMSLATLGILILMTIGMYDVTHGTIIYSDMDNTISMLTMF